MSIPPAPLTEAEVRKLVEDTLALKARIDAEWKAGKRDGVRLGIFGAAEALSGLVRAFDASDVAAFSAALSELGSARMTLAAHAGAWKRDVQAGEREGS